MMNFWEEDASLRQDVDPEPGWSGLYDPWNGRRREPFGLFPQSELYYSTELSDYEDDDSGSGQQEEERDVGEEREAFVRSPSPPLRDLSPIWGSPPSRSPSPPRHRDPMKRPATSMSPPSMPHASRHRVHFNPNVTVFGQSSDGGSVTFPRWGQRMRRRRDEEHYIAEAPPRKRRRRCFRLRRVRGRHSGPSGPHNNLANVLRRMSFLTQPSHFSGLGTGTASSGWGPPSKRLHVIFEEDAKDFNDIST